jgi:two-component system, NarL family, response regulator DevR
VASGRLVGTYAPESKRQQNGDKQMALILFVEYHNAFRQAASFLIDQEPDLEVVAQGGSVAEGRRRMAEGGIDAAIVDIPLPDEGAPEMVRDLHEANPSIPVLVMTALEDSAVHEQMLRAGAAEVLPKEVPFREVLAAVRRLGH